LPVDENSPAPDEPTLHSDSKSKTAKIHGKLGEDEDLLGMDLMATETAPVSWMEGKLPAPKQGGGDKFED
jgi:hypothetical protein